MTIRFSQNLIVLLGITGIVLLFFGCGISEDEHEKFVSELDKIRIENDKIRDELSKSKKALARTEAELDIIKGIGEQTKQRLLLHYNSVDGIRNAGFESLKEVIGTGRASILVNYFNNNSE